MKFKWYKYIFLLAIFMIFLCTNEITGNKPILEAAYHSDMNKLHKCLKKGIDLNTEAPITRYTALDFAIMNNDLIMTKVLISAGADLNHRDFIGNTPIFRAVDIKKNNYEFMDLLIKNGANINYRNIEKENIWDYIWSKKKIFNKKNCKILSLLLQNNIEIDNKKNNEEKTWLHLIAEKCNSRNVIKLILKRFPNMINSKDTYGWTPLHYAALGNNYIVAEELLIKGANVNAITTRTKGKWIGTKEHGKWLYKYDKGSTPLRIIKASKTINKDEFINLLKKYGGKL